MALCYQLTRSQTEQWLASICRTWEPTSKFGVECDWAGLLPLAKRVACHGLLVCDDAPQWEWLTAEIGLCWVHQARHYKKLTPHHALLWGGFGRFYRELLAILPRAFGLPTGSHSCRSSPLARRIRAGVWPCHRLSSIGSTNRQDAGEAGPIAGGTVAPGNPVAQQRQRTGGQATSTQTRY